jgi:hypothetical protein
MNGDDLPEQITEAIRSAIVKSNVESYATNGTYYYDPDAGHNAMTLGQLINAGICKNLVDYLKDTPGVDVQIGRNTVDVVVEGLITLRPAKLGKTKQEDVWVSLPNSRKTALRKAQNNLRFTPALNDIEFDGPRDFFIGHFGDEEGCQAVYLCAPAVKGKARTLGWRLCVPLYIEDDEDNATRAGGPRDPGSVPPETNLDDDFGLGIRETEDEETQD